MVTNDPADETGARGADKPSAARSDDTAGPVSQAEIDEVMAADMSAEERQSRLRELSRRLSAGNDTDDARDIVDREDGFAPMEAQISSALSMLAEGGHIYGAGEPFTMGGDARSDLPDAGDDDDLSR